MLLRYWSEAHSCLAEVQLLGWLPISMLYLFVAGRELGPDQRGIWLGDSGRIVQGHQLGISNLKSILVEVKGQFKLQVLNTCSALG